MPRAPFDFDQFKRAHYRKLATACTALRRFYRARTLGRALTQKQVAALLAKVEAIVAFRPHLPNAGAGVPSADKLAKQAARFKRAYLGKAAADASYWHAQEIAFTAFEIHNYMSALCDEDGPAD